MKQMVGLIARKKAGGEHSPEEIAWLIKGYTQEEIPDYQMAAWLMAVCWRGMTFGETLAMTTAMASSGRSLSLQDLPGITLDKHSTGGVADTTTLVLAPWLAAAGAYMAKMSGRGLGFTGGTIDKLEAIPGFCSTLTEEAFLGLLRRQRLALTAQSADIAPADGRIYALRDVTATVDSIPLIAASIMSKKLAAGAASILLDVKVGRGAFMKTLPEAIELAQCMVAIGVGAGRRIKAILTAMEQPLGQAVGNALEVAEAVDVLRGGGPLRLRQVCQRLAVEALLLAGLADTAAEGALRLEGLLQSGAALQAFRAWITAQGGADIVAMPSLLPQSALRETLRSPASGYVQAVDALLLGEASVLLGAGRLRKGDPVDGGAGILLACTQGETVTCGQPLATLHASSAAQLTAARQLLAGAFSIGPEPPPPQQDILGWVDASGFHPEPAAALHGRTTTFMIK